MVTAMSNITQARGQGEGELGNIEGVDTRNETSLRFVLKEKQGKVFFPKLRIPQTPGDTSFLCWHHLSAEGGKSGPLGKTQKAGELEPSLALAGHLKNSWS